MWDTRVSMKRAMNCRVQLVTLSFKSGASRKCTVSCSLGSITRSDGFLFFSVCHVIRPFFAHGRCGVGQIVIPARFARNNRIADYSSSMPKSTPRYPRRRSCRVKVFVITPCSSTQRFRRFFSSMIRIASLMGVSLWMR